MLVADDHGPGLDLTCRLISRGRENNTLEIFRDHEGESLEISFQRTVRVPDNKDVSQLPPAMGKFGLHQVSQYKAKLPHNMAAKGGLFFSMYQREAMWIRFESTDVFAIKIFVGGVNAVSGEPASENPATILRRLELLRTSGSVQDYVVTPEQYWLDGIATMNNLVRQFVAMPSGSGYSVEAQISGEDIVSGLQFEITPQLASNAIKSDYFDIVVKTLLGSTICIRTQAKSTVWRTKWVIQKREGIPIDQQRLLFKGQQLMDDDSLEYYGVKADSVIHLVLRLRGGGPSIQEPEMAVAPGGLIKQGIVEDPYPAESWDRKRTISFNVQILSSDVFQRVTGLEPPETPVDAKTYAEHGLPFYELYEENSNVAGNFGKIKSVKQMDAEKGKVKKAEGAVDEPSFNFPVTILNPHGPHTPFRPVSELKEYLKSRNAVQF